MQIDYNTPYPSAIVYLELCVQIVWRVVFLEILDPYGAQTDQTLNVYVRIPPLLHQFPSSACESRNATCGLDWNSLSGPYDGQNAPPSGYCDQTLRASFVAVAGC